MLPSGRRACRVRSVLLPSLAVMVLLALCFLAGCGRESPEATVYHFLGAVQAQDFSAMRSFVSPEARKRVENGEEERREWEELQRRYLEAEPNWRFRFQDLELRSRMVDSEHALVTLAGGRCVFYRLKDGRWVEEGGIDFSREEFVPFYLGREEGEWYLEALDVYILYALETACRE